MKNAKLNGVEVDTIKCDILEKIPDGKYDVIVSNPPYIETDTIFSLDNIVSSYEPLEALDGGFDGLMFYRRIAEIAQDIFDGSGFIAFEIGYNQGDEVTELLKSEGFSGVKLKQDACGNDRVITAKLKQNIFDRGD